MSTSYPPKKPPPPYSNGKAPKASAYQPLATEEDWDGDADEADLEARIAPEFRYTRRGPILELEDSKATRSPERLCEWFWT